MALRSLFTNSLEMDLFYMVLLSLLLMAGDVETNPGPYNKDILPRLAEDLSPLSSKYMKFGVFLKVPMDQIKCFERECFNDTNNILLKIIDFWLCATQEEHRLKYLLIAVQKVRFDLHEMMKVKYTDEDFKDVTPITESSDVKLEATPQKSTNFDENFKDVTPIIESFDIKVEATPQKSTNFGNSDIAPNVFMGLENNDVQIVELERQTIEISNKFKKILVELFKFIESNGSARSKLKWFMSSQKCIPSIYCKSNKDYDSLDFSNSVDIMEVLVDHCSFFNYEMLDDAVNVVDFKKGKEMLQLHKENFKAYTQNRVMECPTSLGKTNSDQRCCYVFLDDNFKYYKQVYLKQLHHDISKILNRSIKDVRVGGVYTGSVVVILHLSASLVNEVFPLTQEKVELIKNIDYEGAHILKILCEFHSYTFDSTMEDVNPSFPSVDLKILEEEFWNYIDRLPFFEKEITAALTPPEILYGVNMHWHASHGHLEQIQRMIRKGCYDPSKINEHGNTALHCAAQSGHLTLVKYCIETLKLDFIQKNSQNRSLLHLAAISCNTELVQYLLAMSCFDLYDKDMFDAVPLHYSCGLGNVDITQILIEKMTNNITLNKMLVRTSVDPSFEAFNPFHIAIGCGQTKVVYYFIKNLSHNCSEDVFSLVLSVRHSHILQFLLHTQNFSSEAKHLALFMAVNAVFVDSINFLSTVVHCKIPQYVCMKNLPLSLAVQQGDLEKIQFLAKAKNINWNEVSIGHRTLLHQACLEGHLHVAKYLIEEQNVQVQVPDKNKCSPLHLACAEGNVQLIKYLVNSKAKLDPLFKNSEHNIPLHYASIDGRFDAVKFFLDTQKLDPNVKGSGGSTPLHFACQHGYLNIVPYLIENWKCDPLCKNDLSCTPLDMAVLSGHLNIVKYITKDWSSIPLATDGNKDNLLQIATWYDKIEILRYFLEEKGCDYSMKDNKHGMSLLHVSSISGSLRVTKYLVEVFHMDPKSRDNRGLTSPHLASYHGHLETVKFLKDFFQPYEEIQDNQSNTPLSLAAFKGHAEVVQFLIENGMYDSDSKLPDNDSYLHAITLSGNFVALKLLLKTGIFNVHCQNKYGQTPLMIACIHGHMELAKYLIETHRCDPLAVDNYKNTSLHHSALSSLDIVKYLIEELNLDPNIKGYANNEPLHMASKNGKLDVAEYLVLKHKCDPSVKANFSVCPIHYAACEGHLPVLKFLISQGCNPFTINDGNATPFHMASLYGKLEIIKYYVEEYGSLRDLQQHYNRAIPMARQNQHAEVVSYLESQLPVASAKDIDPVVCTSDEIKKTMPPIMDESINKQKYEDWNRFYNTSQAEKPRKQHNSSHITRCFKCWTSFECVASQAC